MEAQVSILKRKLTMYCKKLDATVATKQQENIAEGDLRSSQEAITAVETIMKKVEEVQQDYASLLDKGGSTVSSEELNDFDHYSTVVEGALSMAFDFVTQLRSQVNSVSAIGSNPTTSFQPSAAVNGQVERTPEARRIDLPPIPIPTFSGSTWEWENFWTLYDANVHSQPIPDLFKFNHLINALKGEPRQLIARFQITEANYHRAVEFLRTKYSDKEALVNQLVSRLETVTLHSPSIKDQRTLLDQLQVIIAQLRYKGEHVDNQFLIKQILTKFPPQLQTKILERKCSTQEPFLMQDLLDSLEKHITCQEKIIQFTSNYGTTSSQQPTREDQSAQLTRDERPERGPPLREASPCMYCGEKHKPTSCTRYITPQQRATYLREHKLCLICASPQHSTDECHGRSCLRCQGRHHTSVCFKAQVATPADTAPVKPQRKDYAPAATAKPKAKDTDNHRQTHKSVKHLAALCQDSDVEHTSEEDVESIAEYHACSDLLGGGETYLPIGELTVHDPSTDQLQKVVALLDSGAECSFIDQQLAEEMQLPTVSTSTLHLRTFGAQQDIEVQTRRVPLKVWDNNGRPHQLHLLTHTTLTKSLQTPSLQEADLEFIKNNGLDVNVRRTRNVKPKIVLGSDQLWQFMRSDSTPVQLPSGLYLLPTRLGHLVTGHLLVGRQKPITGSTDQENENGNSTVQHVTMYAISVADPNPPDKDQAAWEQFPRLNQESQEEFGASDKKIQSRIDEEVRCNFNKTVQKRQDGYNVCLPGKDPPVELPDHKKIAERRLLRVWTPFKKDEDLLAKYHDTFMEQLELSIEEVDEEAPGEYGRYDTDPKQVALVTPNSETSPQPTTAYLDIFSDMKISDLAGTHRIAACTRRFIHKTVVSLNKRRPSRMRLIRLFDDTISTISRSPSRLEIRRANRTLLKQRKLARVTTSTRQALRHLNIYENQHGLLRCRGRLGKNTSDDAKYLILIRQKTWSSRLIIEYRHRPLHTSISHTMSRVREHSSFGVTSVQVEQNYTKHSSLGSITRIGNMVRTTVDYLCDLGGNTEPCKHEEIDTIRTSRKHETTGSSIPESIDHIMELRHTARQHQHVIQVGGSVGKPTFNLLPPAVNAL